MTSTTSKFDVHKMDPRYVVAAACLAKKNWEGAISAFSDLLQSLVTEYGELSLESTPCYYQYGSTLLKKVESEAAVFASESLKSKDFKETAQAEANQRALQAAAGHEEDLEVAWETLETARAIIEKEFGSPADPTPKKEWTSKALSLESMTLERCGDLFLFNELPDNAVRDYSTSLLCLKMLIKMNESVETFSRRLAEAHTNLALAYIHLAYTKSENTQEVVEWKNKHRALAKREYISAANAFKYIIDGQVETLKSSLSEKQEKEKTPSVVELLKLDTKDSADAKVKELIEVHSDICERVVALGTPLKLDVIPVAKKEDEGTTTVGFGDVSDESKEEAKGASVLNVLSVKRKKPENVDQKENLADPNKKSKAETA